MGATGWGDITATQVLAVGLLVVGSGLVAAAVLGRARGLIPIGLLLAMGTLATSALEPTLGEGVGERNYEPFSVDELDPSYKLGIGELVVDLRRVDLPAGTHELSVDLGIGHAKVIVPPGVEVSVTGDVSIGELVLFGREQSGIDNELRTTNGPESDINLVLDLEVGMGKGEVTRG